MTDERDHRGFAPPSTPPPPGAWATAPPPGSGVPASAPAADPARPRGRARVLAIIAGGAAIVVGLGAIAWSQGWLPGFAPEEKGQEVAAAASPSPAATGAAQAAEDEQPEPSESPDPEPTQDGQVIPTGELTFDVPTHWNEQTADDGTAFRVDPEWESLLTEEELAQASDQLAADLGFEASFVDAWNTRTTVLSGVESYAALYRWPPDDPYGPQLAAKDLFAYEWRAYQNVEVVSEREVIGWRGYTGFVVAYTGDIGENSFENCIIAIENEGDMFVVSTSTHNYAVGTGLICREAAGVANSLELG